MAKSIVEKARQQDEKTNSEQKAVDEVHKVGQAFLPVRLFLGGRVKSVEREKKICHLSFYIYHFSFRATGTQIESGNGDDKW